MPYSIIVQDKLKRLAWMPIARYEEGWTRKGKTYPTFKEYLWTAKPLEHYDLFVDVRIKEDERSYWIYYGTLGNFARSQKEIIERAIADILEQLEESDPELIEQMEVKYFWRSKLSEEEIKGVRE